MLCNRPNEFGQQKRPERTGLEPFNSRVTPAEPIGWNPAAKLLPRQTKKKGKFQFFISSVSVFRQPQQHLGAPQEVPETTGEVEELRERRPGGGHDGSSSQDQGLQGAGRPPA